MEDVATATMITTTTTTTEVLDPVSIHDRFDIEVKEEEEDDVADVNSVTPPLSPEPTKAAVPDAPQKKRSCSPPRKSPKCKRRLVFDDDNDNDNDKDNEEDAPPMPLSQRERYHTVPRTETQRLAQRLRQTSETSNRLLITLQGIAWKGLHNKLIHIVTLLVATYSLDQINDELIPLLQTEAPTTFAVSNSLTNPMAACKWFSAGLFNVLVIPHPSFKDMLAALMAYFSFTKLNPDEFDHLLDLIFDDI
jgi:hypothetical protein